MVNRVSSYFPKGGHSATETKNNINTHKVKRHRKQTTENHNKTTALERSVMNYLGGGGFNMFYGANLALNTCSGSLIHRIIIYEK